MHHAAFVIIGRGGVLGIGENYIPIPWEKLGFGANRETAAVSVKIDATKAQLEMAPLVKGSNYATLMAPGFAEQVRRYFGVPAGRSGCDRREKISLCRPVYTGVRRMDSVASTSQAAVAGEGRISR